MNLHTVKFKNVTVHQYKHNRHFNVPLRGNYQGQTQLSQAFTSLSTSAETFHEISYGNL